MSKFKVGQKWKYIDGIYKEHFQGQHVYVNELDDEVGYNAAFWGGPERVTSEEQHSDNMLHFWDAINTMELVEDVE